MELRRDMRFGPSIANGSCRITGLLSMAAPICGLNLDQASLSDCLEAHSPEIGPAITFTALIPDQRSLQRLVRWSHLSALARSRRRQQPNIKPALLAHLAKVYGQAVKAEDMMAYLAAVMAHPAFTARFKADLVRPGLHVPLTADAKLFAEAVALGSEVIWLHCYGERFADPAAGRPKQAPRLPKESAPFIPEGGRNSRRARAVARHHGLRPGQRGG